MADGAGAGELLNGVIDVHTHFVPRTLPRGVEAPMRPYIRCIDETSAQFMVDGQVIRELDSRSWDIAARIAVMDAERVEIQVVSPMPELLTQWLAPVDTQEIAKHVNAAIADMVSRRPDRFIGLGMVSLQEPERAVRELETVRDSGLCGVEVATDVNGLLIGDERFEQVFMAAEHHDLCMLVHPVRPPLTAMHALPAADVLVGYPLQTGKLVVDLVFAKLPFKFPRLKLIFSHGGGAAAALLRRCAHGWRSVPAVRSALAVEPLEAARRFFYDTLVYDPRTLQYLIDTFGAAQLMVGSDFPFVLREPFPGHDLADLAIGEDERTMIRRDNALQLFRNPSSTAPCGPKSRSSPPSP